MTVTLYQGDCLEILPTLTGVDAVITDPPYGISLETNYKDRKRAALAECNNFAPIAGDDKPFDPSHLLGYKTVVLFGANYYADKLPSSAGWIVWDKLNGLESKRDWGFNDNADLEMIWTNIDGAARLFPHRWMGMLKESESNEKRIHPTQKPVFLMRKIIERYTKPGDTVLDPYMGSGSTGVACVLTGRDFIGIEIDPYHFGNAKQRIEQAQAQPALEGV